MEYSLAIGSAKEALPHPPRTDTRRRDDVHTEQSERVRLAESCSTPRDVYRKRGAKSVQSKLEPGDVVVRQGTVLSEARGLVWVRWDEGPKSCHLGAYLEAR
jgi:hypothetical protein